jgi:hypothetical protein
MRDHSAAEILIHYALEDRRDGVAFSTREKEEIKRDVNIEANL